MSNIVGKQSLEGFFDNLARDEEEHVILNMFDNSILHDSFLESACLCSKKTRGRV